MIFSGQTEPDRGRENQSSTVLIVEDEDSLRVPVTKILRRGGFVVIEAADGRGAVDCFRAREAEISVVLLDVTLPSMSGPEVFDELRSIRPEVKVVLTSAYGEETVMHALGGGRPWAYIRKPYSPRELTKLLWMACQAERE